VTIVKSQINELFNDTEWTKYFTVSQLLRQLQSDLIYQFVALEIVF